MLRDDPAFVRILKNSGWLLSAKGASMPIQVAQSVLAARLLGVAGFGTIGLIITYVEVARRIASFRMNEVVIKFLTDALVRDDRAGGAAAVKAALIAELVSAFVGFAIVWATVPVLAPLFFDGSSLNDLILVYSLSMLIDCVLESATGALQVFDRFRVQAIADVIGKAVTLSVIAVAYALDGGLLAVLVGYLVGNTVSTGMVLFGALAESRRRLGARWWRTPLSALGGRGREMRSFAITTNVGGTLSLIVKDSELLWLGYFTTPAAAGFYRLAKSWISMVVIPAAPLVKSFYPEIARTIAAGDLPRTRKLLRKGTLLAATWIVPVGLVFLAVSPWTVPWLYGDGFSPAIPTFALLLLGVGFADILFWMRPALLALGRPDVALRITILNTVLKIALTVVLVPIGGQIAMASITGGLFILGTLIGVAYAMRALHALEQARSAAPPEVPLPIAQEQAV